MCNFCSLLAAASRDASPSTAMVLPGTPLATIDMGAALDVGDGVVTVSFVQDGSARQYYSDGTVYDFETIDWTDYEIEQAMAALATYETFLPIEFRRIDDEEAADFVLFKSSEVAPVFAWMYSPGGPNAGLSG